MKGSLRLPLLCAALCASGLLYAQPAGSGKPVPLLPDIDPQDIEIRGTYRPQFAGIRRQPILGFNPVPPVFSADSARIPFMETPDQTAAATTFSYLERPPQPTVTLRPKPETARWYLQGGAGRFLTPEFRAVHEGGGEIRSWNADLNWLSSDGHDQPRNTAFRFASARAEYVYRPFVDTDWRGGLHVANRYLNLYDTAAGLRTDLARTVSTIHGFGSYRFLRGLYRRLQVDADLRYDRASLSGLSPEAAVTFGVTAAGSRAAAKQEHFWRYTGALKTAAPTGSASNAGWTTAGAMLGYSGRTASGLRWQGGLAAAAGSDRRGFRLYVLPVFDIRVTRPGWLDLHVSGQAEAANLALEESFSRNYFLKRYDTAGNEYSYRGAAEISVRPNRLFSLHGALEGRYWWSYRMADRSAAWDTDASDATDFTWHQLRNVARLRPSAGVKIWLEESGLVWYNEIYWQRFQADPGQIPFQEDLGMVSDLTWNFMRQWFGELSLRYVSDRPGATGSGKLDGFMLLDARIEYRIDKKWGVYLAGQNLLNAEYALVNGYFERPAQYLAGVTARF